MKKNRRLREELAEAKKENLSLKSGGILRKGNRLEAYRFIDEYRGLFSVRWLLRRLEIYLHEYQDEESLYRAVEHFAYATYNHVRPHSYNGYRTPFKARYST